MDNKKELINPVEFFPTGGSKFIRSPDQVDQEKKNTSEFIKPVQFEERHKDFEDKVYIILYYINGDDIEVKVQKSQNNLEVRIKRMRKKSDIQYQL